MGIWGKNRVGQGVGQEQRQHSLDGAVLTVAAGEVGFLLTVSGVTRAREVQVSPSWLSVCSPGQILKVMREGAQNNYLVLIDLLDV